jgi:methylglutaconyl-CoA hydratase
MKQPEKTAARYRTLEIQQGAGGVVVVWLNRPDVRNAIDDVMVRELSAALDRLEADAGVRVVALAGRGPSFCAGADLNYVRRMSAASLKENERDAAALAGLFHRLHVFSKPTVARVHGAAYAGGIGLICACDIAVAAMDAQFCLSEVKVGLAAASMAPQLVAAIGERHASRYLLSAEVFTAAEAYRIGLVQEIAPTEELDASVNELLGRLLLGGPAAQSAAKELLRSVAGTPYGAAQVADGARRFAALRASPECREGVSAFLEKRDPAWVSPSPAKTRRKRSS